MKLTVPRSQAPNPLYVLRRAGYATFIDPVTKSESFVLRLSAAYYPRFHVYVDERHDKVTFDLHLDQKQPSYGSAAMHNGEYEGPTIEREMKRIETWIRAVARKEVVEEPKNPEEKPPKNLMTWLFG